MDLNSNAIKPFELKEDERHRRVALPPSKELNRESPMHPSQRRLVANRRRRMRPQASADQWRPQPPAAAPAAPARPATADEIERDKLKLFPELAK